MKRAALLLLPLLICACKAKVPGCSDKDTYVIIRSIIHEQVDKTNKQFARSELDFSEQAAVAALTDDEVAAILPIRDSHATAFDAGIKQFSCSATIDVAIDSDGKQTNLEVPITYDSQLDDNNDHLVNLRDFTGDNFRVFSIGLTQTATKKPAKQAAPVSPKSVIPAQSHYVQPPASEFATIDGIRGPLVTRYGVLTIDDESVLKWNDKTLEPSIHGNSALSFLQRSEIGSSDVILVMDTGGTACPALFYFVTVNANSATATSEFGSCSDLIKSTRTSDTLYVSMMGNAGPNDRQVYSFSDGVLTENGKQVTN